MIFVYLYNIFGLLCVDFIDKELKLILMVFEDMVIVFLLMFNIDVNFFDDVIVDGEYDIFVDVKVVVKVVVDDMVVIVVFDGDLYIIFKFFCNF